jgi:hypothetical protein
MSQSIVLLSTFPLQPQVVDAVFVHRQLAEKVIVDISVDAKETERDVADVEIDGILCMRQLVHSLISTMQTYSHYQCARLQCR